MGEKINPPYPPDGKIWHGSALGCSSPGYKVLGEGWAERTATFVNEMIENEVWGMPKVSSRPNNSNKDK